MARNKILSAPAPARHRVAGSLRGTVAILGLGLMVAGCAETLAYKPGSQSLADGRNLRDAGDLSGAESALRTALSEARSVRIEDRVRRDLAQTLLGGEPGPEETAEAIALLRASAPHNPSAKRDLALIYLEGRHVEADPALAARLLRESAGEDPSAALELARAIGAGSVTPEHPDEWRELIVQAVSDLTIADEAGSVSAARQLGVVYSDPAYGLTDLDRAEGMLLSALDRGDRGAILPLTQVWFTRDGTGDKARAEALLARGAAEGAPDLAIRLAQHRRDEGAYDDAIRAYAVAARAGYVPAYSGVASLLMNDAYPLTPTTAKAGLALLETGRGANPEIGLALGRIRQDGRYGPADPAAAAALFREAAESGLAEGALYYGLALKSGEGVGADPVQAARYLRRAADRGEARALTDLAELYADGPAVIRDESAARRYFELAAQGEGGIRAARALADLLREGRGGPADPAGALDWTLVAARSGSVSAMQEAGDAYAAGRGTSRDLRLAADWYAKAAESGSVSGAVKAGWAHAAGRGVPRDQSAAGRYFNLAVAAKPDIALSIAQSYALGEDGVRDEAASMRWFGRVSRKLAAEKMGAIARNFDRGHDVRPDADAAQRWFFRAAEAGDARSMEWIAEAGSSGQLTGISPREAEEWYRRAAIAGSYDAATRLARRHTFGLDGSPDLAKAFDWWLVAARGGSPEAQFRVGMAYLNGSGVTPDRAEAGKWLRRAEKSGFAIPAGGLLEAL